MKIDLKMEYMQFHIPTYIFLQMYSFIKLNAYEINENILWYSEETGEQHIKITNKVNSSPYLIKSKHMKYYLVEPDSTSSCKYKHDR